MWILHAMRGNDKHASCLYGRAVFALRIGRNSLHASGINDMPPAATAFGADCYAIYHFFVLFPTISERSFDGGGHPVFSPLKLPSKYLVSVYLSNEIGIVAKSQLSPCSANGKHLT